MPSHFLKGIKILDLSRLIPGPFASLILSDLGATITKVEDVTKGDDLKQFSLPLYEAFNRGKKMLKLNLKTEAGLKTLKRHLKKTDVLLESYRPGILAKMGLTKSVLQKLNPNLKVVSVTGYGQKGPHATHAGHDINYLSMAGLISPSHLPQIQWADLVGGSLWAVIAVLSALSSRKKKFFLWQDVSMTDSMIFTGMVPAFLSQLGTSMDILHGALGRYQIYETADGLYVTLAALEDKFWYKFCDLIEKPKWKKGIYPDRDPQIKEELRQIFKTKTRQEWVNLTYNHDLCLTPVLGSHEVLQSAQFQRRKYFVQKKMGGKKVYLPKTPLRSDLF